METRGAGRRKERQNNTPPLVAEEENMFELTHSISRSENRLPAAKREETEMKTEKESWAFGSAFETGYKMRSTAGGNNKKVRCEENTMGHVVIRKLISDGVVIVGREHIVLLIHLGLHLMLWNVYETY